MKTFLMSSAAAILFAGSAFAQAGYDLSQVDANQDQMVDRDEFRAAYGDDVFGRWDANSDGVLTRDEYQAGMENWGDDDVSSLYDPWAEDESAEMNPEDFEEGIWTHYDVDQSGTLEPAEVQAWDEYQMRYDATRSGREVSQ